MSEITQPSSLLYGESKPRRRSARPDSRRPELEPSTELANGRGRIRHLMNGTEIESVGDLEELYGGLLKEVIGLREAEWTVRSDGRKVWLVKPDDC